MSREQTTDAESQAHAELWGGLERDLERLQALMDGAVEQLRIAFGRIGETASEAMSAESRASIGAESRRVITCLQFHDIASQMIANMRSRAALLELAALTATPGAAADERSHLLARVLHLAQRRPGNAQLDRDGDIELF